MAVNLKQEYISVPGGFVCLNIYGSGSSKDIPILYIHGGPGGNIESFRPMAERFAESRTVYLYNQLGCDENSHTGEEALWTPERYIEALCGVIKAIGAPGLHLIGRSWGAYLAAEHIVRTKDSPAASAVMISPFFSTKRWISDAKSRIAELGEGCLEMVEQCERDNHFDGRWYRDIIEKYNNSFRYRSATVDRAGHFSTPLKPKTSSGMAVYRHMWGPSEFTCCGNMKDLDITGRLHEIKIPVLLICGEFDQVRQESCEYYRSLIPGARLAVIPDASQTSYLEEPDIFYWTLKNFYECF
ncbi:MAG: proline iminopeptidase-family hydrolase [Synergistes sp.]|nr:proline iminopeptidase-family hydrolase [Synergistes sp.]